MSQQKPLSVLVSGAGVAGMTLALALARHPTMQPRPIVTVLERFATPRTTGQAIDIRGPAVRLLHQLEIEGKVRARHTTETGIAFIGMNGKEVARFDKTDDSQRQSATSEYEILRGDLVGLLMEETEEAKKISGTEVNVVCGEYITSLKEEEDGVAVTFANGKLQPQKFDVVIASDGMASRTRPMIFPDLKPEECIEPWGMYVAYFTIPRIESDTRVWKWFHAPGGLAVHLRPHRDPNTMGAYLGITLPTKAHSPELDAILAKGPEAEKVLLHERFKGLGWEVDRILSAMDHADDFYMHHSCRVEVSKWTTSRCALIGDTAHATMGIGTSNAMIGGYMVAGELAKMKSNSQEEIAAALKRYEEGLRPLAGGEKSKGPPGYPQMANPQTSWGISLFHTIAWVIKFTRLEKLLMMGVGEPDENEWKLPSYGFTGSN